MQIAFAVCTEDFLGFTAWPDRHGSDEPLREIIRGNVNVVVEC